MSPAAIDWRRRFIAKLDLIRAAHASTPSRRYRNMAGALDEICRRLQREVDASEIAEVAPRAHNIAPLLVMVEIEPFTIGEQMGLL